MLAIRAAVSSAALVSPALAAASLGFGSALCAAQEPASPTPAAPQRPADEEAVRAAARAYLGALERGDGRSLAAMWTPDGDIVDDDGRVMNGRETVAATAPVDAASRPAFDLRETSLRFLSADVAVEDGEVQVTPPGSTAVHTGHFTALWVRQAGAWRLAGLRESRIDAAAAAPKLADLEWMVGDWVVVDEPASRRPGADVDTGKAGPSDQPAMEVSVRWDEGRAFLVREMRVVRKTPAGQAAASHITQRIGWDPLSRQLRSWSFSSDGGHAESTWTREGDTWIARAMAVMPDGTQTSSLNLYTYDGADRYIWRSLPTHVGGEHLPQVTMTMARKKGSDGK
jgi:uncharacterized protein (TIGR02246 family)